MTYQSKTLFFYKGSCFPISDDTENLVETMMGFANKMIVAGLRAGVGIEEQKTDYKNQMDAMEQAIFDNTKDARVDYDTLDKAMESLKVKGLVFEDIDAFYRMWSLNVCALLKMNVINNDNDNGFIVTKQLNK